MAVVTPTIHETKNILQDADTIINSIEFKKDKVVVLFGKDVDQDMLVIISFTILLSIVIWYYTGLLEKMKNDIILLLLFTMMMIFFISQIFLSSTLSGSITLEESSLISIDQLNSALMGSLIILIFVTNNLLKDNKLNVAMYIIIGLLMINHIHFNVKSNGSYIRFVRNVKEEIFNIAIFTLIAIIYLFLKGYTTYIT